jgi:hypothetical protein
MQSLHLILPSHACLAQCQFIFIKDELTPIIPIIL